MFWLLPWSQLCLVFKLEFMVLWLICCNDLKMFSKPTGNLQQEALLHTWYLSFFLHWQNFWRIKFTPKKRVNYDKIHSKLPIFRVKSLKIYTGQKKFTRTCPWRPWQISGMLLGNVFFGRIVRIIQMMHSHNNLQYTVFVEIVKEGLTFNVSSSYTRSNVAVE